MASLPRASTGLLVPVAAVVVWQLAESTGLLRYEYLPSPLEVVAAFTELLESGELIRDLSHTLTVSLAAAAIALTAGGVLGLVIGLVPTLARYTVASIDFLRTIPAVALVPVAVITFGPSAGTELMLALYAAMWPVVLCTAAGTAAVHPRRYDVARTLHISRTGTVRSIVIPTAVPAWSVGARLSAVIALLVAIVAEMIMSSRGLGGGLVESLNALAPARMWAYALVCGGIGLVLNVLLIRAVRAALPGSPATADIDAVVPVDEAVDQPTSQLCGLLPIVAALVAWQLLGTDDSLFFPPPRAWVSALNDLKASGSLIPAAAQTLSTYLLGLMLAILVGVAAGIAIGSSRRIDRALTPSIAFMVAVPAAAIVPVAALLLGPTQLSGVVVVAMAAAWPVLLATATAMRTVPTVRLEMSRTLGLTAAQRLTKVVLPSLLPGALLGVRVASATALIVTLLVDIFGVGAGLGRLLIESQQRFETATAWGLLLAVGTFGYLASAVLAWLSHNRYMQRDGTLPNWSSRSIWASPPLSTGSGYRASPSARQTPIWSGVL